jgi:hypothetical protein
MRICSVEGCDRPGTRKSYCAAHYCRWRKYGNVIPEKKLGTMLIKPFYKPYLLKQSGYMQIRVNGKYKLEHLVIAENVLGRTLKYPEVVHHANENRSDNRKENLVICPDRAYHNLLHVRLRAQKACGDPSWRKCSFCQTYDSLQNLYVYPDASAAYHPACVNTSNVKRLKARKGEISSE